MVKVDRATWKKNYFAKLKSFLAEYPKILIVNCDNVGSKQLQNIRLALRGSCEILFGKNTMMRRAIMQTENTAYAELLPHIKGNVGFIFTHDDLAGIRDLLLNFKVAAPARVGAIAPDEVVVPKGPTGLDAQKTSFFQALNIQTKIARGAIEIVNDVKLLQKDDRVGPSEAALLNMLGISPFSYGLLPVQVYDNGSTYSPSVMDITEEDIIGKLMLGAANVAAVSLACGLPNAASVPHMVANGYKNVLAVAVATEISFPLAEKAKAFLADPSAFIVAAPAAATGGAEEKKDEPEPEPEEESDDDMDGFSLFD
ncbi:arbp-prov protein [Salpingoeca rosetta]|uniref:60S acidic ribosomal protein P0 n=1 Tax=Salpingoeca rosetta (strain ATCC 50818 / BSB-021) TaxID=946362 RepID=F2U1N9_SALR5|nr:arbp-prov protein [Salpingoeca rosetta]EGD81541.1 arbp-prov protein [Salpingoeca rosetta]|eukprot:XP_004996745.1 arbp-prov protein [Salpingoeca rosetta]